MEKSITDATIEKPTELEPIIDLETTKEIGLTISLEVIARANKIVRCVGEKGTFYIISAGLDLVLSMACFASLRLNSGHALRRSLP